MATIVNTPARSDEGAGWGVFLGVIVLILLAFFLFAYGLPALRDTGAPAAGTPNEQITPPTSQVE